MKNYREIIIEALQKTISEHGYQGTVQNRDIHEQALSHRLAYHLENSNFFTGYNVDCEYNRHGDDTKEDSEGRFRPDIIIHVRGNDDDNLIMIETKKFNDPAQEIEEVTQDLQRRKREFRYKNAFLVIFPENEILNNSIFEI